MPRIHTAAAHWSELAVTFRVPGLRGGYPLAEYATIRGWDYEGEPVVAHPRTGRLITGALFVELVAEHAEQCGGLIESVYVNDDPAARRRDDREYAEMFGGRLVDNDNYRDPFRPQEVTT